MTLYISDIERTIEGMGASVIERPSQIHLKAGLKYLIGSILTAAAAAVYELFSHGVYSNYMIYAFMIPLIGGALPELLTAARTDKKRAAHDTAQGTNPRRASGVRLAVIVTLTAGCLAKGVLDIYGTTNRLLIIYPIAAVLIAVLGFIAGRASSDSI